MLGTSLKNKTSSTVKLVVKENLDSLSYNVKSSDLIMTPKSSQYVDIDNQDKVLNLMDIIDNHDDVTQVYSNLSFNKDN